jgi:hypothetical protein
MLRLTTNIYWRIKARIPCRTLRTRSRICIFFYRWAMGRPSPARQGPMPRTTQCHWAVRQARGPSLRPRHSLLGRFLGRAGPISTACQAGRASQAQREREGEAGTGSRRWCGAKQGRRPVRSSRATEARAEPRSAKGSHGRHRLTSEGEGECEAARDRRPVGGGCCSLASLGQRRRRDRRPRGGGEWGAEGEAGKGKRARRVRESSTRVECGVAARWGGRWWARGS